MKKTFALKSVKLKTCEEVILWKLTFCKKYEEKQICFWVYNQVNETIKLNENIFALFKSWVEIRKDSVNTLKRYKT